MRAGVLSCSLGVLYGGLGISKMQFLIKTIKIKFSSCTFFSILGYQTLDPDPQLEKCWIRIRSRINPQPCYQDAAVSVEVGGGDGSVTRCLLQGPYNTLRNIIIDIKARGGSPSSTHIDIVTDIRVGHGTGSLYTYLLVYLLRNCQ